MIFEIFINKKNLFSVTSKFGTLEIDRCFIKGKAVCIDIFLGIYKLTLTLSIVCKILHTKSRNDGLNRSIEFSAFDNISAFELSKVNYTI